MKTIGMFFLFLIISMNIFSLTYESSINPSTYFLELVNQYRISNELAPFECIFNEIPQAFTDFQAKLGIFLGHIGFSDRVKKIKSMIEKRFGLKVSSFVIAENVAFVRGYEAPLKTAFESFLKSSKHRNNILSSKYKWTAIGISESEGRLYICQMFWDFK